MYHVRSRTTEHVRNRHDTIPIREDYLMTTAPERVLTQDEQIDALGRYGFGWADTDVAGASAQRGLSEWFQYGGNHTRALGERFRG